ncbi:putative nuclease HARBI1 [Ixodes scapularis]|uniref:putative nuclease HARBI1 n=1 Tax=Ixodes scapularis TaxID=6945 RepID=UPI001A9D81BC|nr:putative nuclease HARBI1 [Ixodes scapularis]
MHCSACNKKSISRRRRPRQEWVRLILRLRENLGEYHHLVRDMRLDDGRDFFMYFRMTRQRFEHLLSLVGPLLLKKVTFWRTPIAPAERLSLTIRYLAHGASQAICSTSYRIGRSTTSGIIRDTCMALYKVLDSLYRLVPNTAQWERLAAEFGRLWNFPNCVGALDGKHVAVQAPPGKGSDTFNYKGFHSIVLLASCDASYKFKLSRARRIIEYTFGILVARWRIFRQTFQASEETLEAIVWAYVNLHNYLRVCDESEQGERRYCPVGYADQEAASGAVTGGQWRSDAAGSTALSDGEVPWQYNVVFKGSAPES